MKKTSILPIVLISVVGIITVFYFFSTDQNKSGLSNSVLSEKVDVNSILPEKSLDGVQIQKKADEPQITQPSSLADSSELDQVILIDSVEMYESLSQYGKLASALRGTDINGNLQIDEDGKLVVSKDILSLFQYFLMASHEEGVDISIDRIKEYIQLTLPRDAEQEALDILQCYLDYQDSLANIDAAGFPDVSNDNFVNHMRQAVEKRKSLRREHMSSDVVDAFFANEEASDEFALNRIDIMKDDSLEGDDKEMMLEDLENQLPEGMKQIRLRTRREKEITNEIAELEKEEGNEDAIYALRENFYGTEVADRLTEMYKKREEWDARFDSYYETKQNILSSEDYTDEEKDQLISQIKEESFAESELSSLGMDERIRDSKEKQNKES